MEIATRELVNGLQALYGNLFISSYLNEQTIEMWDDSIRAAGFTSEDVQYAIRETIKGGESLPNFPQLYSLMKINARRRNESVKNVMGTKERTVVTCPFCERHKGLIPIVYKKLPGYRLRYPCPHDMAKLESKMVELGFILI